MGHQRDLNGIGYPPRSTITTTYYDGENVIGAWPSINHIDRRRGFAARSNPDSLFKCGHPIRTSHPRGPRGCASRDSEHLRQRAHTGQASNRKRPQRESPHIHCTCETVNGESMGSLDGQSPSLGPWTRPYSLPPLFFSFRWVPSTWGIGGPNKAVDGFYLSPSLRFGGCREMRPIMRFLI
ncbi:hypothetical protein B296_00028732 [Ensete ventricosum]|uniref:Uncharacterized protein n=1 Tax=Ensete ventricosum TaxID=4639 RepID=A0A426Y032_ENSVE|nr:hypothetical protein B296_00028732 [Ensete ventricosum]